MENNNYQQNYAPPPLRKNRPFWPWVVGLGAFIIVLIVICAAVWSNVSNSMGSYIDDSYSISGPSEPYVAVLHIEGEMSSDSGSSSLLSDGSTYNQQYLLDTIDYLINDDNNSGLMLYIDSPGGTVYAADELYYKLLEYQQTDRPVYSYGASMMASGGYYVAASSDKILLNRNCTTGSIGVTFGTFIDISQFLNDLGIKSNTITSGKNKGMGNIYEGLSDEQIAIYQSLIDGTYQQFLEIVSLGRDMDMQKLKPLADGRIYSAQQAVDNGLADGIATYEEAYQQFITDCGFDDASEAHFNYTSNTNWFTDMFTLFQNKDLTALEAYLSMAQPQGLLVYYQGY